MVFGVTSCLGSACASACFAGGAASRLFWILERDFPILVPSGTREDGWSAAGGLAGSAAPAEPATSAAVAKDSVAKMEDLFISSLTVAEIRRGILELPKGKKRSQLETWFSGPEGPQALFPGRVLAFDESAALIWAQLMSAGRAAGMPRSDLDMIIAAVAEANDCTVVADNERHLPGLKVLNPSRIGR